MQNCHYIRFIADDKAVRQVKQLPSNNSWARCSLKHLIWRLQLIILCAL